MSQCRSSQANAAYGPSQHNYTVLQAFEWYIDGDGKHWKLLHSKIPEFAQMGITALWLPPPCKASSANSVGYDIYDVWDLGEFKTAAGVGTKYGTKAELKLLMKTALKSGIVSYVDAVLNHKFGADHTQTFKVVEVDAHDRTREISQGPFDIDGWTGFEFPARAGKQSDMKWTFNHFTGVDWDDKGKRKGIFRIVGDNKGWALGVDHENRNYDYLMGADIDHAHPEAAGDLFNWGEWIVRETGHVGFRFDAIKHIDEGFIRDFVSHVRTKSGRDQLFCVGEFWKDSLDDLEAYLDRLGEQFSVFDTPLHYNFKEAGDRGENFDLRQIFDGTLVQRRPIDAVTIVDNHDTQVGQSLESWVPSWFKPLAYALILLRTDGYPCVFYGDLYGCKAGDKGDNPHAQQPITQLADIIRARKYYAYGETRDYWDYPNCIGWVRVGDNIHDGCAVVICNGTQDGTKWMEVGKDHIGEKWIDILGWYSGEITINGDGWAEFKCHSRSISIWTKENAKCRDEFGR